MGKPFSWLKPWLEILSHVSHTQVSEYAVVCDNAHRFGWKHKYRDTSERGFIPGNLEMFCYLKLAKHNVYKPYTNLKEPSKNLATQSILTQCCQGLFGRRWPRECYNCRLMPGALNSPDLSILDFFFFGPITTCPSFAGTFLILLLPRNLSVFGKQGRKETLLSPNVFHILFFISTHLSPSCMSAYVLAGGDTADFLCIYFI